MDSRRVALHNCRELHCYNMVLAQGWSTVTCSQVHVNTTSTTAGITSDFFDTQRKSHYMQMVHKIMQLKETSAEHPLWFPWILLWPGLVMGEFWQDVQHINDIKGHALQNIITVWWSYLNTHRPHISYNFLIHLICGNQCVLVKMLTFLPTAFYVMCFSKTTLFIHML